MHRYSGFTLIEILVVIFMVTMIGVFVVPVSLNQMVFARVDSSANIIASSIFKQQQNRYSGYMNSEFGIVINQNSITLYSGDSIASATSTNTISLNNVSVSTNFQNSTIHFENGLVPTSSGSIYVSSGDQSLEVVINPVGLIYVNK